MTTPALATFGTALVWGLIVFMNINGWVGPYVLPTIHDAVLAEAAPGYGEQIALMSSQSPMADALHRVGGSVLLALGALQFSRGLRKSQPRLHRWMGRGYLLLGTLSAVTGLVLAFRHSYGGFVFTATMVVVALAYLSMLVLALRAALGRRYTQHREWMVRSYALVLFIATMRIYVAMLFAFGGLGANPVEIFNFACVLAIATNLVVAEWWLTRTRHVPIHSPA